MARSRPSFLQSSLPLVLAALVGPHLAHAGKPTASPSPASGSSSKAPTSIAPLGLISVGGGSGSGGARTPGQSNQVQHSHECRNLKNQLNALQVKATAAQNYLNWLPLYRTAKSNSDQKAGVCARGMSTFSARGDYVSSESRFYLNPCARNGFKGGETPPVDGSFCRDQYCKRGADALGRINVATLRHGRNWEVWPRDRSRVIPGPGVTEWALNWQPTGNGGLAREESMEAFRVIKRLNGDRDRYRSVLGIVSSPGIRDASQDDPDPLLLEQEVRNAKTRNDAEITGLQTQIRNRGCL